MASQRLDKLISVNCGVSRRDAKKLIKDGKVRVNGAVQTAEALIEPETDVIEVDGFDLTVREHIYIMLNKPQGVISASADPRAKTVVDLVPEKLKRRGLFPAGRLDMDTTGLLIITDDGDFAHRLISPSHHVFKTYRAVLESPLPESEAERLRAGIELSDGTKCLPARVNAFSENGENIAIIKIREGKYHQVKRMAAACSNKVTALHRQKIGALALDPGLNPGECRELTADELELIFTEDD